LIRWLKVQVLHDPPNNDSETLKNLRRATTSRESVGTVGDSGGDNAQRQLASYRRRFGESALADAERSHLLERGERDGDRNCRFAA